MYDCLLRIVVFATESADSNDDSQKIGVWVRAFKVLQKLFIKRLFFSCFSDTGVPDQGTGGMGPRLADLTYNFRLEGWWGYGQRDNGQGLPPELLRHWQGLQTRGSA